MELRLIPHNHTPESFWYISDYPSFVKPSIGSILVFKEKDTLFSVNEIYYLPGGEIREWRIRSRHDSVYLSFKKIKL